MFSMKTCITSPKNTRKKAVLLILTVTVLSMVLMGAVYDTSRKDIDIIMSDDFSGIDTVKTVTTNKAVVADVLAEAGIELSGTEVVEPLLSDDVSDGDKIYVYSGRKVTIKDNTMKDWKEIQLEDGNAGWVPTSVIEVI